MSGEMMRRCTKSERMRKKNGDRGSIVMVA